MAKKALSYLLLLLMVFQSLEAMADVHPTDHAGSAAYAYNHTQDSASAFPTKPDPHPDQHLTIDPLSDCHHHSCHFHVYLFSSLAPITASPEQLLASEYASAFPEALPASLYRPPIV